MVVDPALGGAGGLRATSSERRGRYSRDPMNSSAAAARISPRELSSGQLASLSDIRQILPPDLGSGVGACDRSDPLFTVDKDEHTTVCCQRGIGEINNGRRNEGKQCPTSKTCLRAQERRP